MQRASKRRSVEWKAREKMRQFADEENKKGGSQAGSKLELLHAVVVVCLSP
jgi:hypothetical protein